MSILIHKVKFQFDKLVDYVPFLTKEQNVELSKRKRNNQSVLSYLNSLNIGDFDMQLLKNDISEGSEEWLLIYVPKETQEEVISETKYDITITLSLITKETNTEKILNTIKKGIIKQLDSPGSYISTPDNITFLNETINEV